MYQIKLGILIVFVNFLLINEELFLRIGWEIEVKSEYEINTCFFLVNYVEG